MHIGMTQATMASQLNCDASMIRLLEKDKRTLQPAMRRQVQRLVDALPKRERIEFDMSEMPVAKFNVASDTALSGAVLREVRQHYELTAPALAAILGVSASYVRRAESGSIRLGARWAERLNAHFGTQFPLTDVMRSPERLLPHFARVRMLLVEAIGICELCGWQPEERFGLGARSLLHVHHLVPSRSGGAPTLANSVLLCPNCHAGVHSLPDHGTPRLVEIISRRSPELRSPHARDVAGPAIDRALDDLELYEPE